MEAMSCNQSSGMSQRTDGNMATRRKHLGTDLLRVAQ
jgi:hypothetical protein